MPAAAADYGYFSGYRYADGFGPHYRIGGHDYRYRVDGYGTYYYRADGRSCCERRYWRSRVGYGLPRSLARNFNAYYYSSRGGLGHGYWTTVYTTDGYAHHYRR
jgi:hypothetical protein